MNGPKALLGLSTASLLNERRPVAYAIIFGVWFEVFVYCLLHDQYLIRIAPEHFTLYHPPLWGIENHTLLASAWAFRASIGPGLVLGMAALFVGRAGTMPKMPVRKILKVVACLIIVTEVAGLLVGAHAWLTGEMLYPEIIYPEVTRPLVTTQSIQLTCYLVGALSSTGFLVWVFLWRRKAGGEDRKMEKIRGK